MGSVRSLHDDSRIESEGGKRIRQLIDLARRVRPLSRVAHRFLDPNTSTRFSIEQISNLVQEDAGLAARLLRLANSSFFGMSRRVCTLPDAIRLVGLKGVRNLVIGVGLQSIGENQHLTPWVRQTVDQINTHCLATAIAARRLGQLVQPEFADELFLAGLIHDLGRVMLLLADSQAYQKIWELSSAGQQDLIELELQWLGIDHVNAIEVVGREWNLPEHLLDLVVSHHPSPRLAGRDSSHINAVLLRAANGVAKVAHLGASGDPTVDIQPLCELMSVGWSIDKLSVETIHLIDEVSEIRQILSSDVDSASAIPEAAVIQAFFEDTFLTCCESGGCMRREIP